MTTAYIRDVMADPYISVICTNPECSENGNSYNAVPDDFFETDPNAPAPCPTCSEDLSLNGELPGHFTTPTAEDADVLSLLIEDALQQDRGDRETKAALGRVHHAVYRQAYGLIEPPPPAPEPWHLIAPRRLANGHQRTSWTVTFDHEAGCWYWLERLDVLDLMDDEGCWENHGTIGSPLMDEYLYRCTPDDAEADLLDKLSVDDSAVALRQLAPFVARMLDLPGVEFRRDGDRFTIHPAAAVGA